MERREWMTLMVLVACGDKDTTGATEAGWNLDDPTDLSGNPPPCDEYYGKDLVFVVEGTTVESGYEDGSEGVALLYPKSGSAIICEMTCLPDDPDSSEREVWLSITSYASTDTLPLESNEIIWYRLHVTSKATEDYTCAILTSEHNIFFFVHPTGEKAP